MNIRIGKKEIKVSIIVHKEKQENRQMIRIIVFSSVQYKIIIQKSISFL